MGEQREAELIEALQRYGIACTDAHARLLVQHLDLVVEKNKSVNLTRITDPHDALFLHIVDSALPLASEFVTLDATSHFCDIGTGAGFPGIPLHILTGASACLIDSVGKKVNAVNEFIQALGLSNICAKHTRAEELAKDQPAAFNFVFVRAVAQSNVLIEYATPLLKNKGLLVLEKALPTEDELEHAKKACMFCGLQPVSRETFDLPHNLGHRTILIYQKVSHPKLKLPRHPGQATHFPLGL